MWNAYRKYRQSKISKSHESTTSTRPVSGDTDRGESLFETEASASVVGLKSQPLDGVACATWADTRICPYKILLRVEKIVCGIDDRAKSDHQCQRQCNRFNAHYKSSKSFIFLCICFAIIVKMTDRTMIVIVPAQKVKSLSPFLNRRTVPPISPIRRAVTRAK